MMTARRVSVFGSTGSVGVSTLDLLDEAQTSGEARVAMVALVGGANVVRLAEQALKWRPEFTVIADPTGFADLTARLSGTGLKIGCGMSAVMEAASLSADWVMAAIVGAAGLRPTLAAAKTGAIIAIANKESIVCAGPYLLATAKACGGGVIPVDSEHSALFQALQAGPKARVRRLILTASGGPFRGKTLAEMADVTPQAAMAHPVWSMGPKISLDSATLANKGLEMIEAAYLFETPADKIDVVVHPESIVHSLVEFEDGSTLAQLGPPDMRTPIALAYAWPDRLPWAAPRLDLPALGRLTFEAPDLDRFPMLRLARESLQLGGHAPCAFNAANEVAAAAFLQNRIGFLNIATVVEETLLQAQRGALLATGSAGRNSGDDLEAALYVDHETRRLAETCLDLARVSD